MKFEPILILIFYWLNSHTMADPGKCMTQSYATEKERTIWKKFNTEFSILGNAKKHVKKIFGREPVSYSLKDDMLPYICACAIFKRHPKNGPSFKEILEKVSYGRVTVGIYISYFIFERKHDFPSIYCEYGDDGSDDCIIIRGPKRLSTEKPVYNIYVGKPSEDKFFDFLGIINNVDVEAQDIIEIPIDNKTTES